MTVLIGQTQDVAACLALRRVVFIDEQGVSEADEVDGLDPTALHVLAADRSRPVGCARIILKGGAAKIGRVCVLQSHRGTGLGARLVRACLAVGAEQPGITRAELGAQLHALGFYERLGFKAFGPVFDDAGIDHRAPDGSRPG